MRDGLVAMLPHVGWRCVHLQVLTFGGKGGGVEEQELCFRRYWLAAGHWKDALCSPNPVCFYTACTLANASNPFETDGKDRFFNI